MALDAETARQQILTAIREYSLSKHDVAWVKDVEDEFMRSDECPENLKELARRPDVGWPIMIVRDEVATWGEFDHLMSLPPGLPAERRVVEAQAHLSARVDITAEATVTRSDLGD